MSKRKDSIKKHKIKKLEKKRSIWNNPIEQYSKAGSEIFDNLPKYKANIHIIEGTDLQSKDLNGFSDPYVKVFVNEEKCHKTKIIKKTLNPIWGENCSYYFMDEITPQDEITFEVWDWDRLSPDDAMGMCKVKVNTLLGKELGKKIHKTIKLEPKKKEKVKGTISFSIQVIEVEEKFTISVRKDELRRSTTEILLKCFSYLYIKDFFRTKGIFRKAAQFTSLSKLKADILKEQPIHLNEIEDAHVVACFIKQFLRDLEEPIFTYDKYYELLDTLEEEDPRKRKVRVRRILETLPETNYESLNVLFVFLEEVANFDKENLMTSENLSIVFSPNILRCKDDLNNLKNMAKTNTIVNLLIKEVSGVFKKKNIEEITKDTLLKLKSKSAGRMRPPPPPPRKALRIPLDAIKKQFTKENEKEVNTWKNKWKDVRVQLDRANKSIKLMKEKLGDIKKRVKINEGDLIYLNEGDLNELKEIISHSLFVVENERKKKIKK